MGEVNNPTVQVKITKDITLGFINCNKDFIKIFYESFANKKKQPSLLLKTNGATYSIIDKEDFFLSIFVVTFIQH